MRGKGWVEAGMLLPGDELVLQNGKSTLVKSVWYEELANPVTVYNFEVEDFHTYFVGEKMVLVHNVCKGDWVEGGRGTPEKNKTHHYGKHKDETGATSLVDYNNKAMGFANNNLNVKRTYVPGYTQDVYRYRKGLLYVDLHWNGEEHLLVSFGKRK